MNAVFRHLAFAIHGLFFENEYWYFNVSINAQYFFQRVHI